MRKVFFLALAFLVQPCGARAAADGQEGHGGDIAVSIFSGIAYRTAACLAAEPAVLEGFPQLVVDVDAAIARTKVYSVEKTVLNGNEVDAINYPSADAPRILLNRSRWLDQRLSADMRALLVLHEYLSIAGYDDGAYSISYPRIQQTKACINKE